MPYGAVDVRFWTNGAAKLLLNDTEKLAFLYLLTSPHSNMIGFYRLPLAYMAHDLRWTTDQVRGVLKRLTDESTGPMVLYDYAHEIVLIPAHLKYNPPGRGNREIGAMALLDELPSTPLLVEFYSYARKHVPDMRKLLGKAKRAVEAESLPSLFEITSEPLASDPIVIVDADAITGADRVLARFNELRETAWNWARYTPLTARPEQVKHLNGRLSEGFNEADLILIAEYRAAKDGGDEQSRKYFVPSTLYNTKNFEGNLALARDWDAKGRPTGNNNRGARGRSARDYEGVME